MIYSWSVSLKCVKSALGNGSALLSREVDNLYTLIDTGERLRKKDVTPVNVSYIVLISHYDDHCGVLHNVVSEDDSTKVVMTCLYRI